MNEEIKKITHVKELWDKLDPRDRDAILRRAKFQVNTHNDWKALYRQEQENLVRWLYF